MKRERAVPHMSIKETSALASVLRISIWKLKDALESRKKIARNDMIRAERSAKDVDLTEQRIKAAALFLNSYDNTSSIDWLEALHVNP